MPLIEMIDVVKEFKIKRRKTGALRSLREFLNPQYDIKRAVDGISLDVEKGELIGYIGPNGAGKSTTLKMLTGILVPTRGQVLVDGYSPYKNRRTNALRMGAVFGQRSQLLWDLPVSDTLELYQKMYRIEHERYQRNKEYYIELLDMGGFINQPARQLSLGQRMRANLALALLHDPDILYLDEPTIGLDVVAKERIRNLISEINRQKKTTVMLTTHDMADIEAVCQRLVLIDSGKKLYDGSIAEFKHRYASTYMLRAVHINPEDNVSDSRFQQVKREGTEAFYSIKHDDLTPGEALIQITRRHELSDVSIQETPIEQIVRNIYEKGFV